MTNSRSTAQLLNGEEWGIPAVAPPATPRLLIDHANPHTTVAALRDFVAPSGLLYDRGIPIRLARDKPSGGMVVQIMKPDGIVRLAHETCRPFCIKLKNGILAEVDVGLPLKFARMYLEWGGEWNLPGFNGFASAPLLSDDGGISSGEGYDPVSGMWRERVPDVTHLVPVCPTFEDAANALVRVRSAIKTFCFADAETVWNEFEGCFVVDPAEPPGHDESAALNALVTAVCRPSLVLAPGFLFRAAAVSGAGSGKGLLFRCISRIAFGREPHAVTTGGSSEELEKRIGAELMQANPAVFLDNVNNTTLKSDLIASCLTEPLARVRVLGFSKMVAINTSALIAVTGNGVHVSEDLARRFLKIELDARMEDPESRSFTTDVKAHAIRHRSELLAAVLTIWRWGRQTAGLAKGASLGSFEQWCSWVRDPLFTLGCKDPVTRIGEAKVQDTRRQVIAELFATWWMHHADAPVTASNLHEEVKAAADPQRRGRQYISSFLQKLTGTRLNGFMLTRQPPSGKWGATTYALQKGDGGDCHRGHRGHGAETSDESWSEAPDSEPKQSGAPPILPMTPMPSAVEDEDVEQGIWRAEISL